MALLNQVLEELKRLQNLSSQDIQQMKVREQLLSNAHNDKQPYHTSEHVNIIDSECSFIGRIVDKKFTISAHDEAMVRSGAMLLIVKMILLIPDKAELNMEDYIVVRITNRCVFEVPVLQFAKPLETAALDGYKRLQTEVLSKFVINPYESFTVESSLAECFVIFEGMRRSH